MKYIDPHLCQPSYSNGSGIAEACEVDVVGRHFSQNAFWLPDLQQGSMEN